jgi:hypothetical protein
VPLPELLDLLPTSFHATALRAHVPTIDAHRSVHLQHFRDPSSTLIIAKAVASLPAGDLTHLSLSNLSGPPVGWLSEVFAQVGKIHQLAALRLSGTYLHSTGAAVLAPHLATLTGRYRLPANFGSSYLLSPGQHDYNCGIVQQIGIVPLRFLEIQLRHHIHLSNGRYVTKQSNSLVISMVSALQIFN